MTAGTHRATQPAHWPRGRQLIWYRGASLACALAALLCAACGGAPASTTNRTASAAAGPCPSQPEPALPASPGSDDAAIPTNVLSGGITNAVGPRLLLAMVERLGHVDTSMDAVRTAPDAGVARREARTILDLLVGPGGRHTSPTASTPGILPSAQATLSDPGMALTIYGTAQDEEVKQAMDVILGDPAAWQQPADRWTAIDEAVAAWTPTNNSIAGLDGRASRMVGWALLTLQTQDVGCAHQFGANGLVDARVSLRTAREALRDACTWTGVDCDYD